jgi:hypothetical protein
MMGEGDQITVGAPLIDGGLVRAVLVETRKGEKIKIFKKKRRQGYRRTGGHRQIESVLRVTGLEGAGQSAKWDGEVKLVTRQEMLARSRGLTLPTAGAQARGSDVTPAGVHVDPVVTDETPVPCTMCRWSSTPIRRRRGRDGQEAPRQEGRDLADEGAFRGAPDQRSLGRRAADHPVRNRRRGRPGRNRDRAEEAPRPQEAQGLARGRRVLRARSNHGSQEIRRLFAQRPRLRVQAPRRQALRRQEVLAGNILVPPARHQFYPGVNVGLGA